jgi:hypothetical protein
MTLRFTAGIAAADDDGESLCVGVAEHDNGSGMFLTFMCMLSEPDEQDVMLGMDTYCLVTPDQGTAYGGVKEVAISNGVLRVVVADDDLEALGLDHAEIEATLAVDEKSIEQLRQSLRRVLTYGRPETHPVMVGI